MNYYQHHIGDYDSDTAHLEWVEDMAYTRLLRVYYRTEKPIPADIKEACRLVRAKSKPERAAVESVLHEFFDLSEDGWHNKRADSELSTFKEGADEQQQKQAHEIERMRRYRARRKELFATLRERGIVPKWDTGIEELQRLVNANINAPETHLQREQVPDSNAPETAIPITNNQKPESRSPQRGSRLTLPDLPEPWKAYCRETRPDLKPEAVWENFRDFWVAKPGKDGLKLDWEATWRTWVRRESLGKPLQSIPQAVLPSCHVCKKAINPGDNWLMKNNGRIHDACDRVSQVAA